jgi:4-hydroxybenzoate polyprenyltransferase
MIYELENLRNPKEFLKFIRFTEDYKKEKKDKTELGFSFMSDEEKSMIKKTLFNLAYFSWSIIGALFSSQWILFIGLIVFGTLIGPIRKRLYKHNTRGGIYLVKFDAFVSAVALAFIILNHFHHII